MPTIKYVGRTTDFSGKTLWEILGNLKNFGVGRLVKRNVFDRYPEPSFFRILQVETEPPQEGLDRKVRAVVEKVFRGRRYEKIIEIHRVSYKADYRLIPKREEASLWDRVNACQPVRRVVPNEVTMPPLLKYILQEEIKASGQPVEDVKLKINVRRGRENFYAFNEVKSQL